MTGFVSDPGYARRAASLLRAVVNDLKRDDSSADRELGLPPGTFAGYTSGSRPVDWELVARAARTWPVSERDLLPIQHDCPAGLSIMRAKESEASARVIDRGDGPYYEYRDTAMSRLASFRPEWIRMLRVVEDSDPANPAVRWNRGHLLYQFTYFIGPVNYYYRWGDVAHCVEMNTGDSVWGLPFAPHSFTARSTEPAYILALTYGGGLTGDAQRELAALGNAAAHAFALPAGPAHAIRAAIMSGLVQARGLTEAELADRTGLDPARVAALLDPAAGDGPADPAGSAELRAIATALEVSVRDLLDSGSSADGGVRLKPATSVRRWAYPSAERPAYAIGELAGDRLHPHTTAIEIDVRHGAGDPDQPLVTYQHQYLYLLGDSPMRLAWWQDGVRQEEPLQPGDSAYVMPYVPIAFAAEAGAPRILALRTDGAVTTEVRLALGAMAPGGIDRYVSEDGPWYTSGDGRAT